MLKAYVNVSHPCNGTVMTAVGVWRVEGYPKRTIEIRDCRTSHEALYRTLELLIERSKKAGQSLEIYVCQKSMLRAALLLIEAAENGSCVLWMAKEKLERELNA